MGALEGVHNHIVILTDVTVRNVCPNDPLCYASGHKMFAVTDTHVFVLHFGIAVYLVQITDYLCSV